MNIEKTGTFTIDLEPNWNEVVQLAIENLGSDSKQTKWVGRVMVRDCVKPMSEKGVDLWVQQDANVMGGGSHLLSSSDLALWADEAISVLSRDPFSVALGKTRREDEEERSRATNFIKLIGKRLESNRQARRSKVEDGSVISKLEAGGSISLDELDATFVEVPLDES